MGISLQFHIWCTDTHTSNLRLLSVWTLPVTSYPEHKARFCRLNLFPSSDAKRCDIAVLFQIENVWLIARSRDWDQLCLPDSTYGVPTHCLSWFRTISRFWNVVFGLEQEEGQIGSNVKCFIPLSEQFGKICSRKSNPRILHPAPSHCANWRYFVHKNEISSYSTFLGLLTLEMEALNFSKSLEKFTSW